MPSNPPRARSAPSSPSCSAKPFATAFARAPCRSCSRRSRACRRRSTVDAVGLAVNGRPGDLGASPLFGASGRRPSARSARLPLGDPVDRLDQARLPQGAQHRVDGLAASSASARGAQLRPDRNRPRPAIARAPRGPPCPSTWRCGRHRPGRAAQAEDRLGVESEGIGLQPVDVGHRDLGGRCSAGGAARGAPAGSAGPDRRARQRAARAAGRGSARRSSPAAAARSARRRSASGVAPGARDQHARRAERAREIMRGKADPNSRPGSRGWRGSAARATGRARQRGPDPLVQSAQDHQVGLLQPRASSRPQMKMRGCPP